MTKNDQIKAIAEAIGWTEVAWSKGVCQQFFGQMPGGGLGGVPDFTESLDAMHDAFLTLKTTDRIRFHVHLEAVAKGRPDPRLGSDFDYKVSNATAAQRAEAFLKTLNLWTE